MGGLCERTGTRRACGMQTGPSGLSRRRAGVADVTQVVTDPRHTAEILSFHHHTLYSQATWR